MFFTEFELQQKIITDPARAFSRLRLLAKKRPVLVSYLNARVLALLLVSKRFRNTFSQVDYIYPDGWGGVLYLRLLGVPVTQRSTAPDFFPVVLSSLRKKTNIFLLGGTSQLLQRVRTLFRTTFSSTVVGSQHGYFKNDKQVVNKIVTKKPDVVIVGMGADHFWQLPRQEKWVADYLIPASAPMLVWCVGDLFTQLFAERQPQSWYTEWWQRIKLHPQKMLARYAFDAIGFVVVMLTTVVIVVWKQVTQKRK